VQNADSAEKGIRFGCGFVFGLLVGGISSLRWYYEAGNSTAVATIVIALVFGFAALRFGDVFWRWLAKWLAWFN